jgi:hypothetical protein
VKTVRHENFRSGLALLAVLFIVMAVTLISLGFLARADRELACAANVPVRMQMDYLAQSGLEHGKAFIINPQDVDTASAGYWEGDTGLFVAAGDEYYDIEITRDDSDATNHSNYTIISNAYQLDGADKISNSAFEGHLRLDPCIALWTGSSYASSAQTIINGDIFSNGDINGDADINGDVFATGTILATNILGDSNSSVALADQPVTHPGIIISDLTSTYMFEGTSHTVETLTSPLNNFSDSPNPSTNPAGIFYYIGDLIISDDVTINGTLIVNGNLTINGAGNTITAEKNFPAIVVSGTTTFQDDGQLTVNGLVQINSGLDIYSSGEFKVIGGVFITNGAISIFNGSATLVFTAAAETSALLYEKADESYNRWTLAGGGFYKKIMRLEVAGGEWVPPEGGF